jgi:prepilin-type N-terminal cleavage/methylation domain-containing protein
MHHRCDRVDEDESTCAGFALVEVLVVLLVIGIVATTAILVVGGIQTKPISHDCWNEAQRFQQLVRGYEKKNNVVPGVKESRNTAPNVYTAALVMENDNKEINTIATSYFGSAPNQWSYHAKTGVVTPGTSCT